MDIVTPALIVLVGPSGSGKSTWAAANFEPSEVVSSDGLRGMVGAGEDDQTAGTVAFSLLDQIVEERLRRGMTTVVDSLGFNDESRERWAGWADASDLPTQTIVFTTSKEICEARNDARDRPIPKTVLRKQFSRFKEIRESLGGAVQVDTGADISRIRRQEPRVAEMGDATGGSGHTFGLMVSRFDWGDDDLAQRLIDIAKRAEAAGFRDLWLMDHFRQIPQVGRAWEDIPEVYTTLAYLAGVTSRVRLGALVTGITHRHPVVLGKMLASLDVLSGGRAIAGLGIAWDSAEHAAYGIDFPDTTTRYEYLEETLQMLPLLWGKGSPSFEGQHITASELICYPRPLQDPIPIMIGGSGEKKTLRLVAQYADAANVFGSPDDISHKVEVIARHCADFERDPAEIEVTHLTNTLVGADRKDLMAQANSLRDRNQTAEDFIKRNRGGTVDQLVERFAAYDAAGSRHSIVSLPNVQSEGSIEGFTDVIDSLSGS